MGVDEVHCEEEDPGHEQQQYYEISDVMISFLLELLRVVHLDLRGQRWGPRDNSAIQLDGKDAGHKDTSVERMLRPEMLSVSDEAF